MVHPNPYGDHYPRSPRDPLNEPYGGYDHERSGQRDGYGQPFDNGPVDEYGRYNPHGPNSYVPNTYERMDDNDDAVAVIALITGIVAIFCAVFLPILSIPIGIGGVICGIIALNQVGPDGMPRGKSMAVWGIILNMLSIVLSIVIIVGFFAFLIDLG